MRLMLILRICLRNVEELGWRLVVNGFDVFLK